MRCKTVLLIMMFVAAGFLLSAQGLKVDPGTCVKVESETTLDISAGNLMLESDATGDASLIELGSITCSGNCTAKVERHLANGKWHLISSPVSGAVSGMFLGDYLQQHYESTNGYTEIIPTDIPLNIMQGYALWTVDGPATTEVFSGVTNTGNKNFGFTRNTAFDEAQQGWNLVGNPYPSVLDWDAVTKPITLNGAIWLFDPMNGTNGEYRYYIKDAGKANTTSQYIRSGQGFFVKANHTDGGTLTFTNNARTHVAHSVQPFYKESETNQMLLIKATGNNITTQTAIRFNPEATQLADRLYDVFKIISGSPDVPDVYAQVCNETVPMYFEAGMHGTYPFDASEIESLDPEVTVYLEDVAIGYFQNLRTNPSYSFPHISGAVKDFKVHFKNLTGIEAPETLHVACYLSNDVLYVNFPEQEMANMPGTAMLSVYSVTGQQLLQAKITQAFNQTFKLLNI